MTVPSDLPGCGTDSHEKRAPIALPAKAVIESAAMMLRAAGDPSRLRILLLLTNGERCVTELAEDEHEKIATVSARLKHLHSARLVKRRRQAKHIYYALADEHVAHLLHDVLDHAGEDTATILEDEGEIA